MPVKRLTEETIGKLKAPPGKQVDYRDKGLPGLVLRVNFGGKKTWRAAYRKDGKDGKRFETAKPLGRYPIMGLMEAREAARAYLLNRDKAVDDGTFAEVMDLYLERHVRANGLRSAPEIERSLTCRGIRSTPVLHSRRRPGVGCGGPDPRGSGPGARPPARRFTAGSAALTGCGGARRAGLTTPMGMASAA
jgi:hypothetical protein